MYRQHLLLRPQIAGYATVALLSCAGGLTFLLLLLELQPPTWSRPALAMQGLAVVVALLLTYWYRPPRFFLYPIVLDVRTRAQYEQDSSQIPGSVRVLPDQVAEWAAKESRARAIVAYCT